MSHPLDRIHDRPVLRALPPGEPVLPASLVTALAMGVLLALLGLPIPASAAPAPAGAERRPSAMAIVDAGD